MSSNEEPETITFHWADILVFCVYLVFVAGLGVFFGYQSRKKTDTKEFLMGGGEMHWFPTGLSMQASFLSAIFILGTPPEIYYYGIHYYYLAISYLVALPIAAYVYLPVFHRLKLTSAYEYLEMRFSKSVRVAGAITFAAMVFLYLSVVLYTPAIAIAQVTHLSMEASILLTGLVCVFYTAIGGMKATIWNDAFQMTVIFICMMLIIILGVIEEGGITKVWEVADEGGRLNWNSFDPDPTLRVSFWTQSIGGTFIHIAMYASSQTVIQKFLSVSEIKNGQKAIWVAVCSLIIFLTITVIIGLVMYAYYEGCDPLMAGRIEQTDQLLPLYVMEVFGDLHGLPGLFIAACFAAALSSISGSLNALAAIFLVDFIKPGHKYRTGQEMSEKTANWISRILAVVFGLLVIGMSFLAEMMGDMVLEIALGIFGFVGGPLTALVSLGLFFPCCNWIGAHSGLLCSLVITCWIAIGAMIYGTSTPFLETNIDDCPWLQPDPNTTVGTTQVQTTEPTVVEEMVLWVYELSHMYYGVVALLVGFLVGVPVSFITVATNPADVDPALIYDHTSNCCCYCPGSCQDCCRCGVALMGDEDEEEGILQEEETNHNRDSSSKSYGELQDEKVMPDVQETFDNQVFYVHNDVIAQKEVRKRKHDDDAGYDANKSPHLGVINQNILASTSSQNTAL